MNSILVKILEADDIDVTQLSEQNIGEYVQATRMQNHLKKAIIHPFEEEAKRHGKGSVYSEDGLKVIVKARNNTKKHSPKDIFTLLQATLTQTAEQQSHGKQMYGVKRFGDDVTVDVAYVGNLIQSWEDMRLGSSQSLSVDYAADDLDAVEGVHTPRLVLPFAYEGITADSSKLYIAAKEQFKRIGDVIVSPFVDAFKSNAQTSTDETVFHTTSYGGLDVQVTSVPRFESDYKAAVKQMKGQLAQMQELGKDGADEVQLFYNTDLAQPRMYALIGHLQGMLSKAGESGKTIIKQEVDILYKPTPAMIVAK